VDTNHDLKCLAELELQIGKRINEFNSKRAENQKYNRCYSLAHILLGALTTLLIAVNSKLSLFPITVITMTTSTLASVAGQLLSTYMYKERLTMNIATICALYELSHAITMDKRKQEDDKEKHKITLEKVESYNSQYQQILNSANGQWQNYFQQTKTSKK